MGLWWVIRANCSTWNTNPPLNRLLKNKPKRERHLGKTMDQINPCTNFNLTCLHCQHFILIIFTLDTFTTGTPFAYRQWGAYKERVRARIHPHFPHVKRFFHTIPPSFHPSTVPRTIPQPAPRSHERPGGKSAFSISLFRPPPFFYSSVKYTIDHPRKSTNFQSNRAIHYLTQTSRKILYNSGR